MNEISALEESIKSNSPRLQLFKDIDLIHSDELSIKIKNSSESSPEFFSVNSNDKGEIQLTIQPPKGLTKYLRQSIQLEAIDRDGEALLIGLRCYSNRSLSKHY